MILTHTEFTLTCGTLNLTCSMTVSQTVQNENALLDCTLTLISCIIVCQQLRMRVFTPMKS